MSQKRSSYRSDFDDSDRPSFGAGLVSLFVWGLYALLLTGVVPLMMVLTYWERGRDQA